MTARTTMANLITELRGMTEAGTADYTISASLYWSDDQIQDILDIHRDDIRFQQLQALPNTTTGGTLLYYDYKAQAGYLEATNGGTAVTYLQDSTGATLGTALWTADYRRGMFSFNSTTNGTVIYLTSRAYDLNAAAADVWRRKAAHVAPTSFDFTTDNHSISRSQVYAHSLEMADYFENKSQGAITTVQMFRSDTC